jgi:hypothetical protein
MPASWRWINIMEMFILRRSPAISQGMDDALSSTEPASVKPARRRMLDPWGV